MKFFHKIKKLTTTLILMLLLIICVDTNFNFASGSEYEQDTYFDNENNVIVNKLNSSDLEKAVKQYDNVLDKPVLNQLIYPMSLFYNNTMQQAIELYKQDYFELHQKHISTYEALHELNKLFNGNNVQYINSNAISRQQLSNDLDDLLSAINGKWEVTDKGQDGDGVINNKVLGISQYTTTLNNSISDINNTINNYIQKQIDLLIPMITSYSFKNEYPTFLNDFYSNENKIYVNRVKNSQVKNLDILLNFTNINTAISDVKNYLEAYDDAISQNENEKDNINAENKAIDDENHDVKQQNAKIDAFNRKLTSYKANGGRPLCSDSRKNNCVYYIERAKILNVVEESGGLLITVYSGYYSNDVYFVKMKTDGHYDDEYLDPMLVEQAGTFKYESVLKAKKTVRAFAFAPENKLIKSLGLTIGDLINIEPRKTEALKTRKSAGGLISIDTIKNKVAPDFNDNIVDNYKNYVYN